MDSAQFNRPAPPGFIGLNLDLPVRFYQRKLPHWRQSNATYFVTFRLADSIPQHLLQALTRWRNRWEQDNPEPRSEQQWSALAKQIFARSDAWMDTGNGECVFNISTLANEMTNSLLYFQDSRCFTSCYAVLGNHVHACMRPLGLFELENVLESVKGFVSRKVNTSLKRSGVLWEQESYDRIIRDEQHLYRVIQYIGRNPSIAGIPRQKWIRWISPLWKEAGWRFGE